MRHSNQARRTRHAPVWAAAILGLLLVACGQAVAPSLSPIPAATPVVTPDPHLAEPVTADQVFRALGAAKLGMAADKATLGGAAGVVKVINADIGRWPLRITEYGSAAALAGAVRWKAGAPPAASQPPFAIAGLNVLVEYGPIGGTVGPTRPDAERQALASAIVGVLDPLLWPLTQHSVVLVPARTAAPAGSAAPAGRPSKAPSKVPATASSNAP
ncbi:MAG: hypothetical protein QOF49_906 [Chloroflexota bacterium]|jgi:hypothetical protein|nr:hypothetical protein [Chloroflexota bacterium]